MNHFDQAPLRAGAGLAQLVSEEACRARLARAVARYLGLLGFLLLAATASAEDFFGSESAGDAVIEIGRAHV